MKPIQFQKHSRKKSGDFYRVYCFQELLKKMQSQRHLRSSYTLRSWGHLCSSYTLRSWFIYSRSQDIAFISNLIKKLNAQILRTTADGGSNSYIFSLFSLFSVYLFI
jgi:hypothetical protein